MFDELNRQLSDDVVAMFRHNKPLYYRDGEHYRPFDAIKETFEPDGFAGAGRSVSKKEVGFQVTGDVWAAIDAATKKDAGRCVIELDGDTLRFYRIAKDVPYDEITGDRHAIRINTVLSKEKKADDDFTGRILRDPS